ncbi:hypothetical protein [Sorangium atrum]|uniref:Uncharacterized protein n=1 Tax=Sorangium atrum TaxID=2995308 RepID=A0ABT5C8Y2_9BACT|nr:hypothetical protein [Sorangium aterium]MDC0682888.1 hypothetical protein [Sorangium aterium]
MPEDDGIDLEDELFDEVVVEQEAGEGAAPAKIDASDNLWVSHSGAGRFPSAR